MVRLVVAGEPVTLELLTACAEVIQLRWRRRKHRQQQLQRSSSTVKGKIASVSATASDAAEAVSAVVSKAADALSLTPVVSSMKTVAASVSTGQSSKA